LILAKERITQAGFKLVVFQELFKDIKGDRYIILDWVIEVSNELLNCLIIYGNERAILNNVF